MRISTANLAAGWTLFANPTLATGFSTDALTDGQSTVLARTTSFGPGTGEFIYDRGVGFVTETYLVAIFGVRSLALGAANIDIANVKDSPDHATVGAALLTLSLDDRGDAWGLVTTTQRYLHIAFHQAAADQLDVPELWVGDYTDLERDIIGPFNASEGIKARGNDADDDTLWADQLGDRADTLTFAWDSLLTDEYEEVRDYWREVRGVVRSHVVVPEITAPDVYLGKLTSARLPRQQDNSVVHGVSLGFRSAGHYFYG